MSKATSEPATAPQATENAGQQQKLAEQKVAILVVHGVAARKAGVSLEQVTDLLTSYRVPQSHGGGGYVRERRLEFPIEVKPDDIQKLLGPEPETLESCDRHFMRQAIKDYKQGPNPEYFKVLRNEIRHRRMQDDGTVVDAREVHLYECFWADLSRGGSYDYLRKFVEFYQLVLDLCSLGRKSIEYAARQSPSIFWEPLRLIELCCELIIVGTIPAINLLLICLLLFSPVLCQNEDFQRWFFPVVLGFITVGLTAIGWGPLSQVSLKCAWRKYWFWSAIGVGLTASLCTFWIFNTPTGDISRTMRFATLVGWVIIMVGIGRMAYRIRDSRPRLAANLMVAIPLTITVLLWAIGRDPLNTFDVGKRALLRLAEVLMAVGQIAWFTYFGLAAVLVFLSTIAMWKLWPKDPKPDQAFADIRALQTLQISTSVAGLLILLVTLLTWQIAPLFVEGAVKLSAYSKYLRSASYQVTGSGSQNDGGIADGGSLPGDSATPIMPGCETYSVEHALRVCVFNGASWIDEILRNDKERLYSCCPRLAPAAFRHLFPCTLDRGKPKQRILPVYVTPSVIGGVGILLAGCNYNQLFCVILAMIAVTLAISLAFARVIEREGNPPATPPDTTDGPASAASPEQSTSEWGVALDEAFSTLSCAGGFVSWGIIFGTALSFIVIIPLAWESPFWADIFDAKLRYPGFLMICGIVLLAAVAKLFGPILAVTLDVINWLRAIPVNRTPRARIIARSLAILWAIARANSRHKYQQLIVVAHSQGTVIAVEILRALAPDSELTRKKSDPRKETDLSKLPEITLFTMGSPLRQLYACRFPHLFDWVYDTVQTPPRADAPNGPNPDPNALYKLRQWVNAYGGMDYVGRALWHRPSAVSRQGYTAKRERHWQGKAVEVCIGDAAHTHYWDTGSPIARYLHEIIEQGTLAATEPAPPAK